MPWSMSVTLNVFHWSPVFQGYQKISPWEGCLPVQLVCLSLSLQLNRFKNMSVLPSVKPHTVSVLIYRHCSSEGFFFFFFSRLKACFNCFQHGQGTYVWSINVSSRTGCNLSLQERDAQAPWSFISQVFICEATTFAFMCVCLHPPFGVGNQITSGYKSLLAFFFPFFLICTLARWQCCLMRLIFSTILKESILAG